MEPKTYTTEIPAATPSANGAWWFLLTIPSSLTWALPNTILGLLVGTGNFLMELIGWGIWPFVCLKNSDAGLKHFPWGNLNPSNPNNPEERDHSWLELTASTRLGVPWALLNGSFFVWRPYTLGNIIYIGSSYDNGLAADQTTRLLAPKAPDILLTIQEALHQHEMQHVFQYALLGPLFHCLPAPLLARLISTGRLTPNDNWWEKINLGSALKYSAGGLVGLLSGAAIQPELVQKWINPAEWWSTLIPSSWVKLLSNAWNLENWLPVAGVYEWDSKFFFDQNNSWLERNAGAHSGAVYQTVVEAKKTEVFVGEFTRVVAADYSNAVNFTITPDIILPAPLTGPLSPISPTHKINFPAQVVNAAGFYFHCGNAGEYKLTGNFTDSVEITVKEIDLQFKDNVFICQSQIIRVFGDSTGDYKLKLKINASGGSLNGNLYTAGPNPGLDKLEIWVKYPPTLAEFANYGDNGLAAHEYLVKTIAITVEEPTISLEAQEIFVGGSVKFTMNNPPQAATCTTNVPGSQFNRATEQFLAGKGPITAEVFETVTLDYGCTKRPFTITVKPILATISPNTVDSKGTAQIKVNGGGEPYQYVVSDPHSSGPRVDSNGKYTAGNADTAVVDTITITDRNGEGGRAHVQITIRPTTTTVKTKSRRKTSSRRSEG